MNTFDATARGRFAVDTPNEQEVARMSYPNRGRRFGRLLLTSCRQAGGHPWIDHAATGDADGNNYRAWAIRPSLRRRQYDRRGGRALVIGWRR